MKNLALPITFALTAAALVLGCRPAAEKPLKVVRSPAGGSEVLTSAERIERGIPAGVSLASYEQPAKLPPPPTVRPLAEWSEDEMAAEALSRIGAPAVPQVVRELQHPDPAVRRKAITVLGRMGSGAKEAVPELIRLLKDPDEQVRKNAALTLGRIGPAAQEAVPALVQAAFAEP